VHICLGSNALSHIQETQKNRHITMTPYGTNAAMQPHIESSEDTLPELYAQLVHCFIQNGIPVDDTVEAFMAPLLDGTLSAEEHEALLRAELEAMAA
jgi:hypothetical protein